MDSLSPQSSAPSRTLLIFAGILIFAGLLVAVVFGLSKRAGETNGVPNVNGTRNANTNSSEVNTEGWKTYANDQWGYSFRYPAYLTVQDYTRNSQYAYDGKLINYILVPPPAESYPYITVDVVNDSVGGVQEYLEKNDKVTSWTSGIIGSLEARFAKKPYGPGSFRDYYLIYRKSKTLVFSCFDAACNEVIPTIRFQ